MQLTATPSPAVAARLTRAAVRAAVAFGAERVEAMSDDALLQLLADATEARNALEVMLASASAEVSRRSARELGYQGLAQRKGHRNSTSLVQNITGQSTGDVRRAVQVGEDLLSPSGRDGGAGDAADAAVRVDARWLTLLRDALAIGRLGQAQFQAIRTGLGEPPVERYPDLDDDFLPDAWAVAVERLVEEAAVVPVEALRAAARVARDRLDPIGVTLRFEERFAARSFRTWIDEHGQHHGRFVFDDDAAVWVHTILSAALRPRRGPRFVPSDGDTDAHVGGTDANPGADDRTNEQLQYDTVLAILRTGANADPTQAFGDRQPGVRIVVEATALTVGHDGGPTRVTGVGHDEELGAALPGGVVETYLCDAGASVLSVDATGRPLDLGREQRLFSRAQRIAIAVRDGGCIWPSCTASPSRCEYHHIDHWAEHRGRTNVDDGVPLCRNCHMRLHNQNWRITRVREPETGIDTYWLHPPPDTTSTGGPGAGAGLGAGAGPGTDVRTGAGAVGEGRGTPTRLTTKSPRRFQTA
ncbi:HNH endonuclease signature motif containing protein [Microbacterium sp. SLBN-146]|uniref:HNH endonuclease signature motif containing protein n=1 Tax=Microbacterium sp. SLBN-146 TaxID=2768457 RepID=UPI00114D5178|nr:HNH endonuclease signature motif containing protein [Microbacterium sp. SLBN-146]TQJ30152.1 HNH endonuclease [Microbacterium sp. SLBN-146]